MMTFAGPAGREVHAVVYPPHNKDFVAPEGELPPFVAFVHGGPTAQVAPQLSLTVAYFTSRGVGVVDVNYGGSTGYGREYRERLRGQWGVVDVEDTIAAVTGLAGAGLADPVRLAIEGGSAGGWTVLAALTGSDTFACGASYYGVAELIQFAEDTHDFESRYLDGLIGPLPAARALYESRAPLNHVAELSCPVLLLQGLDDPIVVAVTGRDVPRRLGAGRGFRTPTRRTRGSRTASGGRRRSSTRASRNCRSTARSWASRRPACPCWTSGGHEPTAARRDRRPGLGAGAGARSSRSSPRWGSSCAPRSPPGGATCPPASTSCARSRGRSPTSACSSSGRTRTRRRGIRSGCRSRSSGTSGRCRAVAAQHLQGTRRPTSASRRPSTAT